MIRPRPEGPLTPPILPAISDACPHAARRQKVLRNELPPSKKYPQVKQWFEETNFKCGPNYYSLHPVSKTWISYSHNQFSNMHEHIQFHKEEMDKKGGVTLVSCVFVKAWFEDETLREHSAVLCLPPPLQVPVRVFNTWHGFPLDSEPAVQAAEATTHSVTLHQMLDHVKAVAGDDDTCYQYLLNWIASIVQFPGSKTRIMPIIKSVEKGTGKGAFTHLLTKLLGAPYCLTTATPKLNLFSSFNGALKDKLFIVIDEANNTTLSTYQEELKSLITEPNQNVRMLYREVEEVPSFVNVVLLTNRDVAWEHNDRRPLYLTMTSRLKGDNAHFKAFYTALEDKRAMRVVHDYFRSRDLTNFHLESHKPITETQRSMEAKSCPIEVQFLVDYGLCNQRAFYNEVSPELKPSLRVMSSELFEHYKSFIGAHSSHRALSAMQFGIKMADLIKDGMKGIEKKRTARGILYNVDVPLFTAWLKQMNYYKAEASSIDGGTTAAGGFADSTAELN